MKDTRSVPARLPKEAIDQIVSGIPTEVVISDLRLSYGSGLQILWALKKINPDVAFILITGHASVETAIEAVNEGSSPITSSQSTRMRSSTVCATPSSSIAC